MLTSTIALHTTEARLASCRLSHALSITANRTAASPAGGATLVVVVVIVIILLAAMTRAARGLADVVSGLIQLAGRLVSMLFAAVIVLVLAVVLALHH
jgi:hypothetical protein